MENAPPIGSAADLAVSARDALLITIARGIRQFAYGMLGVVLAVSLSQDGVSPTEIGALITVSLIGDFCGTYVIGLGADQWGRRRTLMVLAVLMAITGAIFGLVRAFPVLVVAAFFGTLGTTASETAPFLPIEQAMLPLTVPPSRRTRLFARYNLVASFAGACGALFAGLPEPLTHLGLSLDLGLRLMFGLYAAAALAVVILVGKLSPRVEAGPRPGGTPARRLVPHLGVSRGIVLRLSALFSVDALAGGLVVQSLLALYFHLRYGVSLDALAALFFGANLLASLSFLAAAPLARRFGLLNTMVFSHLPSNVLLILIPIMPNYTLAALILLLRQLLSQMDVPTRQAYTMALVAPEERTAAASVTSLARSAGSATTPVMSGALMQGPLLAVGIPFLVAGGLKVAYDLALWRVFLPVPVEETD